MAPYIIYNVWESASKQVSSADGCDVVVNAELRAEGMLPSCKDCGKLLRSSILMFDDFLE